MQFQVTYIEFDFSSDDDTWGDVDPDYQQEVTEETIGMIWEADDEDDLIEEITCALVIVTGKQIGRAHV